MTNSKQQEMKLLKVQDFEGISEQRDFHQKLEYSAETEERPK